MVKEKKKKEATFADIRTWMKKVERTPSALVPTPSPAPTTPRASTPTRETSQSSGQTREHLQEVAALVEGPHDENLFPGLAEEVEALVELQLLPGFAEVVAAASTNYKVDGELQIIKWMAAPLISSSLIWRATNYKVDGDGTLSSFAHS